MDKDFLVSLCDALGSSEGQTIEEVKAELREDGVDVEAAIEETKAWVKKCSEASRKKYGR